MGTISITNPLVSKLVSISLSLNCVIVRKGPMDLITDGN